MTERTDPDYYHVKTFLLYGRLRDDGAIEVAPSCQEFEDQLETYINEESESGYKLKSISTIDVTENYSMVIVTTECPPAT